MEERRNRGSEEEHYVFMVNPKPCLPPCSFCSIFAIDTTFKQFESNVVTPICGHWIWLMIRIAEKVGFMKIRTVAVCAKVDISRKVGTKRPCIPANLR